MISEIFAGLVFAKSAKVVIPAATNVEAILGPMPSTFFKSSAFALAGAFLAGVAFGVALFLFRSCCFYLSRSCFLSTFSNNTFNNNFGQ